MNTKIFISCALLALPSSMLADREAEEYRLLKSWGMQFDAQGQLRFKPGAANHASRFNPWSPDLSAYESIDSNLSADASLQPLVISSRQRPKSKEATKSDR